MDGWTIRPFVHSVIQSFMDRSVILTVYLSALWVVGDDLCVSRRLTDGLHVSCMDWMGSDGSV